MIKEHSQIIAASKKKYQTLFNEHQKLKKTFEKYQNYYKEQQQQIQQQNFLQKQKH